MIGGALGALEAHILPGVTPGFWALIGLSAVVGGVMRSPLTGVVFPLELTHAWPLLLALLIAATAAYTVSALLLKRSVLTEKVARRGLHLSREYAVDPLEVLLVDEVMHTTPIIAEAEESLAELSARADVRRQWLYPVMDEPAGLLGVIPRRQPHRARRPRRLPGRRRGRSRRRSPRSPTRRCASSPGASPEST